ncbi:MAG: IS110 family transposase [Hyphomicrobiales bacterium]|nr:IS110 family transposase [Hyphomicrobiales bacterium]
MEISTIGLDIAKRVFQVHGADALGRAVLRRKLRRDEVLAFFEGLPAACLVGIEACGTAHHWAREIAALGHEVRLLPPAYVKPYVKRGKTDAADAEAICEAVTRPTMRAVPVKSAEQQAVLTLHRTRDLLVRQRTMLVNALRGHMAEFGIIAPQGITRVVDLVTVLMGEDGRVPALARQALRGLAAELESLGKRVDEVKAAILAWHKQNAASCRLAAIPGIGPITASAIVATVGEARQFRSARHFAAWIGLVPKQRSSGGSRRQGSISKQGDRYLRRLLVLGATTLIRHARTRTAAEAPWLKGLLERRPARLASVAQANKTARIAWALLTKGEGYRAPAPAQATAA